MTLLRRLAVAVATIWLAATLAFFLVRAAPGDPAIALGGDSGAPGYAEDLARLHGRDQSHVEVYLDWLARLMQGDLGVSYRGGQPVATLILERLPVTLALMVPALCLSLLAGLAIGLLQVPRPGRPRRAVVAAMAGLHAVPSYLVAHGLVLIGAVGLGLMPVQGLSDPRTGGGTVAGNLRYLVLPVLSLALHHLTFMALLTRVRLAAEAAHPYFTTARAKGLSWNAALRRHALRNAMLPIVTLSGARFGAMIGGTVIIETVFALPGLGRLAVTAALGRDHPTIVGITLVACAAIVLVNLLADVALRRLDPRLAEAGP